MFGQINSTPYDLRFSLFGIPIRVHPAFWLISGMLGWRAGRLDLVFVWVCCVFVSILVHELGHALVAKWFGWPPEIVLFHFGGYAAYNPIRGHTAGRSILISFAGPGAGFLLFGVVFGVLLIPGINLHPLGPTTLADWVVQDLVWINLAWGLVNLLPVLPLDGGRISEEVCHLLRPRDGQLWAHRIAIVVSGLIAFLFVKIGLIFGGIMFGLLCFQNFQAHQSIQGRNW